MSTSYLDSWQIWSPALQTVHFRGTPLYESLRPHVVSEVLKLRDVFVGNLPLKVSTSRGKVRFCVRLSLWIFGQPSVSCVL